MTDLDFTPIGFAALDAAWWPVIANTLPRPWPREAVLFDLRWWRDQELATAKVGARRRAKMPGRPALCQRWGWGDWDARQVLRAEVEWADTWTKEVSSSSGPPAGLQPASSVPPVQEQTNAENAPNPSSDPPAVLQPASSVPPRACVLTETPITEHQEPEDREPAAPAADTPRLAPWVPKVRDCGGHPRDAVEAMVLRAVEAIRQRPVTVDRCATDAKHVLGLWRALGRPPPHEFGAELVLVADWAQRSPDGLAARDIRAEGWAAGTDRRNSVDTLCRRERWADRTDAAQRWDRSGRPTAPVDAAGPPPRPSAGFVRPGSGLAEQLARRRRERDSAPRPPRHSAIDTPFEEVHEPAP